MKIIVGTRYEIIRYSIRLKDTGDLGECVSCEHACNDPRPIYSPLSKSFGFHQNPPRPFRRARHLAENRILPRRVADSLLKKRKDQVPILRTVSFKHEQTVESPLRPRVRHSVAFFFVNHHVERSRNAVEAESRAHGSARLILSRLHRRDGGSRTQAGCQRKSSVAHVQGHDGGLKNAALLLYLHFSQIIVILIGISMRTVFSSINFVCFTREMGRVCR